MDNIVLRVLSIFLMLVAASNVSAAPVPPSYISDDVSIYIHGGPSSEFRIIGSIEAGQPITLLSNSKGKYTEIIDHKGREGWVLASKVTDKPSFRVRFPEMEAQFIQANEQLNHASLSTDNSEEYLKLANEKIADLTASLALVTEQRDTAESTITQEADNQRYYMWQQGGLIAGLGALIGIVLVYLPRPQRRNKNRWM